MSQNISLKDAERKVFRTAHNDGLWDIFLGCFFLEFALAPLLSTSLGDFWSSAVFLPILLLVYLTIRLVRRNVIIPRIGVVKFGRSRINKLKKFTFVMLVVNIIAAILGFITAINFQRITGETVPLTLGMIFLIGFSIAAHFLDFSRLYFYGLLAALSPLVGEWLFINGIASHHGFPIAFGTTAGIMIIVGFAIFIRLLHKNPILIETIAPGEK